jgi:hypothetical protein
MTLRMLRNLAPVALPTLVLFLAGCAKPQVTVPDVADMPQAAASAAIASADLSVGTVTQAYSSTVTSGSVISQVPEAGASVSPGTPVLLTVSEGPQPVTVPNVVGRTQAEAQTAITGGGLSVGEITRQHSASVPQGGVISQSPEAGASLAPGTAVALIVSDGPEGAPPGSAWNEVTVNVGWSPRITSTAVFDGKLWVIGGNGPPPESWTVSNDVWSSSDGVAWHQATAGAGWSPRMTTTAVFDNRLWVFGGADGNVLRLNTNFYNDVWWSSDGVTWNQATANADWSARGAAVAVFNDKLWVLGGLGSRLSAKNDVWWSSDGATWHQATANAEWSARGAAVAVFNGKMWILGGMLSGGSTLKNDVWWSSDGAAWTRATSHAEWLARGAHTAAVFDDKLWVVGGMVSASASKNDVWWSSDGVKWQQAAANTGWSARGFHATAVFDNALWVIGGRQALTSTTACNDVWRSAGN